MSIKARALVTGAGGFIGSHLAELLVKSGYDVTAFLQYSSNSNLGWLKSSPYLKDMRVVHGNISDYDSVYNSCRKQDIVFHLAALIGIPYSYISPKAYIRTNIEGTYNILESVRKTEIEKVLVTSTSEVYGSAQYTPINELHPLVGQSPYSASKIAADQLAISYYRSFNTPVTIVRPFNTYGPRQSLRAIIPTIICQALMGEELQLGQLDTTRDFNFVEDTAQGFQKIAESKISLAGEVLNIATNKTVSIKDLVEKISNILDKKLTIKQNDNRIRPDKSEVTVLLGDHSKVLKNTDWTPQHSLKEGLRKTIQWFMENSHLYADAREYHI
jgi:NAD dependent epimerase/dehydratase